MGTRDAIDAGVQQTPDESGELRLSSNGETSEAMVKGDVAPAPLTVVELDGIDLQSSQL